MAHWRGVGGSCLAPTSSTVHCSATKGLAHTAGGTVTETRDICSKETYPSSKKLSVVPTGPSNLDSDSLIRCSFDSCT
jgi:hypothetical protein